MREGDHYIVNGQKTWTTLGQYADWIFCLVRTDPAAKKQAGISFLLIDMKTPGITVRPIITLDGAPRGQRGLLRQCAGAGREPGRRGEQGLGLRQVPARQRAHRHRPHRPVQGAPRPDQAAGARRCRPARARSGTIADFRERLAEVEIELKALELTQMRVVAAQGRRDPAKPDPASSILKIKGSQLQQATTELLLEVAGPFALAAPGARRGTRQ